MKREARVEEHKDRKKKKKQNKEEGPLTRNWNSQIGRQAGPHFCLLL